MAMQKPSSPPAQIVELADHEQTMRLIPETTQPRTTACFKNVTFTRTNFQMVQIADPSSDCTFDYDSGFLIKRGYLNHPKIRSSENHAYLDHPKILDFKDAIIRMAHLAIV